jgi:hypothetical protein
MRDPGDREELFTRLSGWVEVPGEEMEERYNANVYSPYLPMPVKEDVDQDIAVALRERAEDFPGVHVVEVVHDGLCIQPGQQVSLAGVEVYLVGLFYIFLNQDNSLFLHLHLAVFKHLSRCEGLGVLFILAVSAPGR